MRTLRTCLVLLALAGFLSPRVTSACCAPAGDEHGRSVQAAAAADHIEAARHCCPASGEKPASEPSGKTPQSPQPSKDCHNCCGVVCCVKLMVPPDSAAAQIAPTTAHSLIRTYERLPASRSLTGIFRPPRLA